MLKRKAPVYAFFSLPEIEYDNISGQKYYVFSCVQCRHKVRQGATTRDRASTGQMNRHVTACWGEDVLEAARETKSLAKSRLIVEKAKKQKNMTITDAFKRAKGAVESYSTTPPSKSSIRSVTHLDTL